MKIAAMVLAAAGLALATSAAVAADAGAELLQKNGCMACHGLDTKIVGPAYKDVAAKYKGDAAAPAKLVEKVKQGGSGVWGPIPMPPHPQISEADLKAMVTYILALKK